MKKLLVLFAIGLSLMGITRPAHAIMIDPFISYEYGQESEKFSGVGYGARLAWDFLGFWIGAEYASTNLKGEDTSTENKMTDIGLSVGYEFPILVRGYMTYMLDTKAAVGANDLSGTGTKIGIGYTGLPFIAINYEIIKRTYTKLDGASLATNLVTDSSAISVNYTFSF